MKTETNVDIIGVTIQKRLITSAMLRGSVTDRVHERKWSALENGAVRTTRHQKMKLKHLIFGKPVCRPWQAHTKRKTESVDFTMAFEILDRLCSASIVSSPPSRPHEESLQGCGSRNAVMLSRRLSLKSASSREKRSKQGVRKSMRQRVEPINFFSINAGAHYVDLRRLSQPLSLPPFDSFQRKLRVHFGTHLP